MKGYWQVGDVPLSRGFPHQSRQCRTCRGRVSEVTLNALRNIETVARHDASSSDTFIRESPVVLIAWRQRCWRRWRNGACKFASSQADGGSSRASCQRSSRTFLSASFSIRTCSREGVHCSQPQATRTWLQATLMVVELTCNRKDFSSGSALMFVLSCPPGPSPESHRLSSSRLRRSCWW